MLRKTLKKTFKKNTKRNFSVTLKTLKPNQKKATQQLWFLWKIRFRKKINLPRCRSNNPSRLPSSGENASIPDIIIRKSSFSVFQFFWFFSSHHWGWETEKAIEVARKQIADLINADPKEIVFTSGATESNNLAIKGLAKYYGRKSGGKRKKHFITSVVVKKYFLKKIFFYKKFSLNDFPRNINVYWNHLKS